MPNVLDLTFTRSLVEFVRTGCFDAQQREIFPQSCVTTFESWIRGLYRQHQTEMPERRGNLIAQKRALATGALAFSDESRMPRYDTLFVDEAQDLLEEEVELITKWAPVRFFVGDDRQRIYDGPSGIDVLRRLAPAPREHLLPFHYRLAPEICEMADRIMVAQGGAKLAESEHYGGPRPGRVEATGPLSKEEQMRRAAERLRDQTRAYADSLSAGDFLGIIVARKEDRTVVHRFLEDDPELEGKSQIVRARSDRDDAHDPSIQQDRPICILTVKGCKGLEFRAVHWLFCEQLSAYHHAEHYYTVVTRAKTSLDLYYGRRLPDTLARAYAPSGRGIW
jgi:superfamily I DNA/RNA helicase